MKVPRYDRMIRARSAFLGRPWTPAITWASPGNLVHWQQGTLSRGGRYEIIGDTVIVTTGPIEVREVRVDGEAVPFTPGPGDGRATIVRRP